VFELFSPLVTKQAMENLINVSFSMQVWTLYKSLTLSFFFSSA
jgi:hypothetical protein